MSFVSTYNAITVQSSGSTLIIAANNERRGFVIKNNGGVIIYIGFDANVSTSTGLVILPQDSMTVNGDRVWRGAIYGIAASSTADVRYWEWAS